MNEIKIGITTPYIEVDKLLKLADLANSGGEAHMLILDGCVQLDGKIISEKRKKVYPGSLVVVDNESQITVFKDHEA